MKRLRIPLLSARHLTGKDETCGLKRRPEEPGDDLGVNRGRGDRGTAVYVDVLIDALRVGEVLEHDFTDVERGLAKTKLKNLNCPDLKAQAFERSVCVDNSASSGPVRTSFSRS